MNDAKSREVVFRDMIDMGCRNLPALLPPLDWTWDDIAASFDQASGAERDLYYWRACDAGIIIIFLREGTLCNNPCLESDSQWA